MVNILYLKLSCYFSAFIRKNEILYCHISVDHHHFDIVDFDILHFLKTLNTKI